MHFTQLSDLNVSPPLVGLLLVEDLQGWSNRSDTTCRRRLQDVGYWTARRQPRTYIKKLQMSKTDKLVLCTREQVPLPSTPVPEGSTGEPSEHGVALTQDANC